MWPRIAELGGTIDVLREHDVEVDDKVLVPGIEIPNWINSEHPDINADRLQYAIAEMLLWFDHEAAQPEIRETVRRLCSLDNFDIDDDGNMVFKDQEIARLFAKGYLLLATEHWNDPINRVQLHLLIHATQRVITKRRIDWMAEIDKNETRKPDDEAQFSQSQGKIPTLSLDEEGITYRLGPFKNRYVDPLVKTPSGTKRLSEIDHNYLSLLEQQQHIQKMGVVVKLAFAGGFEEAFKEGVRLNDEEFNSIKERSPMTSDQQRRVIERAAVRAKQLSVAAGTLALK
jgi:hypothetical protein